MGKSYPTFFNISRSAEDFLLTLLLRLRACLVMSGPASKNKIMLNSKVLMTRTRSVTGDVWQS